MVKDYRQFGTQKIPFIKFKELIVMVFIKPGALEIFELKAG
jgi:hypothetical protein